MKGAPYVLNPPVTSQDWIVNFRFAGEALIPCKERNKFRPTVHKLIIEIRLLEREEASPLVRLANLFVRELRRHQKKKVTFTTDADEAV